MITLLSTLMVIIAGVPGSGEASVPGPETATEKTIEGITAREVIERIKEHVTCDWSNETVDTFKAGDPDSLVTGIACTFTPTIDVIRKAAALGCNLIISHEPTFYNHLDNTDFLEGDPVFQAKMDLIDKTGTIIFRFHDHWHMTDPDGIYKGMIRKLGWNDLLMKGETSVFELGGRTVQQVTGYLKSVFPEAIIRVIGDPSMMVEKAAFSAGAPGSVSHIRLLERVDIDLIVIGEAREWETVEYVRDAVQAGHHKAMIILGHAVSEESGMEYCAEWLSTFISEVPVHFVEAGDPFHR